MNGSSTSNRLAAGRWPSPRGATIDGDRVTIHGARNFNYRTETDFVACWQDRTYDLRTLDSGDLVAVYGAQLSSITSVAPRQTPQAGIHALCRPSPPATTSQKSSGVATIGTCASGSDSSIQSGQARVP